MVAVRGLSETVDETRPDRERHLRRRATPHPSHPDRRGGGAETPPGAAQARRYVASHALGAHLPGTVAWRPLVAIYDTAWLLTVLGLLEEVT